MMPLGDRGMLIEFGDEADLELSFRVMALRQELELRADGWIDDHVLTLRSLAVFFDPSSVEFAELAGLVREVVAGLEQFETIASRLVRIPVWYDDPWSAETAERYGVPKNIDFVAEINGLTLDEFVGVHSSSTYWVTAVGFSPGTYWSYALDQANTISAPKYDSPRDWNPDRLICLAGRATANYPVEGPGGYQLLGRTPIDFYDPTQTNAIFADNPVLMRAGDRVQYLPISSEEYHELRDRVERDEYVYEITDGTFDVAAWLRERAAAEPTA
jgi:KipI family sensor histidine kinase inhibitor